MEKAQHQRAGIRRPRPPSASAGSGNRARPPAPALPPGPARRAQLRNRRDAVRSS
jgi:hypothetical protein